LFSICYKTRAKACGYRIGLLQEPLCIKELGQDFFILIDDE
jgi:hypothetical protein